MRIDVILRVSRPIWAVLCISCVGTNPDWDESPADVSTGPIAASETSSAAGTDGSDPPSTPTSTEPSGEDDACPDSDLARCEDDMKSVCVDLARDPHHCGSCFHDCAEPMGSKCIDGECACPEDEWWAVCDGACRKVRDDPRACGYACVDCTRLDGGKPRCKDGVCEFDD